MRLFSQSSQFVFNLPSDLIPSDLDASFQAALKKNFVQYTSPIDYLNHAIKSVTFPGLSVDTFSQNLRHGKQVDYRPATNINDILTTRELSVTFFSKDSDLNYWFIYALFCNYYLSPEIYSKPLQIKCLDVYRDVIFTITFSEIIYKSLSDMSFSYSNQKVASKEFTLTFNFNYTDIEFELDNSKVMQLGKIIDN